MDIYVGPNHKAEEFCKMCRNYKLHPELNLELLNKHQIKPKDDKIFSFHKALKNTDECSFTIHFSLEDMTIKEMMLIDDDFAQPIFCNDSRLKECKAILEGLEVKQILAKKG